MTKPSAFPAAAALTGAEVLPVIQGGVDSRSTPAALATYAFANVPTLAPSTVPDVLLGMLGNDIVSLNPNILGLLQGFNFSKDTMRKWRIAVGNTRAGTVDGKVAMIGDSTMRGQGSSTTRGSLVAQFADLLDRNIVSTVRACTPAGTTFVPADERVIYGTGWTTNGVGIAVGSFSAPTSATGNLSITLDHVYDTIKVYYWRNTTNGSTALSIDGQPTLGTLNAAGANSLQSATFSVPVGHHVLRFAPPTVGTVYIIGVEGLLSTERRLQVWNLGRAGATSASFNTTGNVYDQLETLSFLAPDLSVISLGINDAAASVDVNTFSSNLSTLAARAALSGSVVLMPPPLSSLPPGRPIEYSQFEAAYVPGILYLAGTVGYGVVDWQARFGPYAQSSADGFMNDTVHPNAANYGDMAQVLTKALMSL